MLLPIFGLLALAIRLESPGAALFKQTRIGRWGRIFTMYKFRSMYMDAEARKAELLADNEMSGGVTFKMQHDPRITCIWQVSGRSDIPFPQHVELDVLYIESQSLLTDLKLLWQTVPAVLFGRGAY